MIKIMLGIIGMLAFIAVLASQNADSVNANAPWVILVLCLGFIGMIGGIEKIGKKK